MPSLWPANASPANAWALQTWTNLAARTDKARAVVILPVHGHADHGFGLPLDCEETVGSAVLRAAVESGGLLPHTLVLPPLCFGATPYAHTHFGVETETALDALNEILASVKASGFSRVLLFNTSPWNAEIVGTAALDARVALDLRTYVVDSAGIGLGFHPADPHRARTQAVAARLLGRKPASASKPTDVRDVDFRPGFYAQPAPATFDSTLDGEALFAEAASALADLIREIVAHHATTPPPFGPKASIAIPEASSSDPRSLAAMTAEEIAAIPGKGKSLVIIPTGAIEQHGHHLPLATDAILGRLWLAHALPKLAADAPVFTAPPIIFGKSNEHLGFDGTITLSARTLRRQLLAVAAHLKTLGFRQIAVLNTHGGNSTTVVSTLREIQTALGLRSGMLSGYYRAEQAPQETAFGFHAGEWETSLMLAGAPALVRMDRAVCEYPAHLDAPGRLRPTAAPAIFTWKTSDVSKSGVMGDATQATAEKGARWLDEASSALARKIERLLES